MVCNRTNKKNYNWKSFIMPGRGYSSISSSAKSLLLTKALTTIPFAKEAVGLIWGENAPQIAQARLALKGFLLRLFHFEGRYWSVDTALSEIGIKNILEFSSGFSFRGLSMCQDPEVFYIDTDLPQIIESKRIVVQELTEKYCTYPVDNLLLQALNVLDKDAFAGVTSQFPAGPVAIVNEGLLVYFDEEQKRQLCAIIHDILRERGGYWITADIYLKNSTRDANNYDFFDEQGREFLAKHHVEENKFESFEAAEIFFQKCGFNVYKKVDTPKAQLSSLKFMEHIPGLKLDSIKGRKKRRETWILQPF